MPKGITQNHQSEKRTKLPVYKQIEERPERNTVNRNISFRKEDFEIMEQKCDDLSMNRSEYIRHLIQLSGHKPGLGIGIPDASVDKRLSYRKRPNVVHPRQQQD